MLAGLPLEPVVLASLARAQGLDPARDFEIDTFFLGGAPLPPVMQRRIEHIWDARVIELYGSTETMLLGTACSDRSLHIETDIVWCEFLQLDSDEPAEVGEEARFVVTTLSIEGSPLVRFETGDIVRRLPPCTCGDPRTSIVVLGRQGDVAEIGGQRLYAYEIIEGAAAAADALDSSIFFVVVMPDRLIVRIETPKDASPGTEAAREALRTIPARRSFRGGVHPAQHPARRRSAEPESQCLQARPRQRLDGDGSQDHLGEPGHDGNGRPRAWRAFAGGCTVGSSPLCAAAD